MAGKKKKENRFPIAWVRAKCDGHQVYLGHCGKTGKLYHITPAGTASDAVRVMIVRDMIITPEECEEGEGCLYTQCSLNRTTMRSYWKRHGLAGKPLDKKFVGVDIDAPAWAKGKEGIIATKDGGPLLVLERSSEKKRSRK